MKYLFTYITDMGRLIDSFDFWLNLDMYLFITIDNFYK